MQYTVKPYHARSPLAMSGSYQAGRGNIADLVAAPAVTWRISKRSEAKAGGPKLLHTNIHCPAMLVGLLQRIPLGLTPPPLHKALAAIKPSGRRMSGKVRDNNERQRTSPSTSLIGGSCDYARCCRKPDRKVTRDTDMRLRVWMGL